MAPMILEIRAWSGSPLSPRRRRHCISLGRQSQVVLIAIIGYPKGKVYIQHVLTHKEYDRGEWKDN